MQVWRMETSPPRCSNPSAILSSENKSIRTEDPEREKSTMPYQFEILDNLPVPTVLSTVTNPFDAGRDVIPSMRELNSLLGGIEGERVFVVVDQLDMEMTLGNAVQV